MEEIENMKETIKKIVNEIKERKEKIVIPDPPERCENCIDGEFLVNGVSFTCEKYGENFCLIYQDFIKENYGKNYFNLSIDKVENGAREKLIKYIKNIQNFISIGKGLTIIGSIGSGKTSIIFLIIQELFKKGYPFYYDHAFKFFNDLDLEIIKKKILFIDDLGVEFKSEYNRCFFDYMIDYRLRFRLPTFITSNLSLNRLKEEYPRAIDRLKLLNYFIHLQGGSKRWCKKYTSLIYLIF